MRLITILSFTIGSAAATALAGCSNSAQTATLPLIAAGRLNDIGAELRGQTGATLGVYVSESGAPGNVLEYNYQGTGSPLCTLNLSGSVNSIQSDSRNELIVPESTGTFIYKEYRHSCLSTQPIKQFSQGAVDGFSLDGRTYYLAVYQGVEVCKLGRRAGCYGLINEDAIMVCGVTADRSGVYASTRDGTNHYHLIYWNRARGGGTLLSGYVNGNCGGLYFDGLGDLLSIGWTVHGAVLDVYTGCPSNCVDHGPFSLGNDPIQYGSLGNGETRFMVVDPLAAKIDVYQYNGLNGVTYLYSNGTGLSKSAVGIAQQLR